MLAKSAKGKRYEQRIEQFKQNEIRSNDVPNAEECTKLFGVSEKSITERQNG